MSEKNKKGHDIDFFRGNLPKNEYDAANSDKVNNYHVFKFDPKKKTLPNKAAPAKRTVSQGSIESNKINKNNKNNNFYKNNNFHQNNNFNSEQQARDTQLENKELEKALKTRAKYPEYYNDENIISGKRKPLKPGNKQLGKSKRSYSNVDKANDKNFAGGNGNNNHKHRKKTKEPKKKNKWLKRLGLALLAVLLLLTASIVAIKLTAKPVHFVVIGVDQREEQQDSEVRADALMMVNVSTKDNKIIIASIPRDTYTYIPCEEAKDKITHSYVYGALNWENKGGSIACTTAAVSTLTNIDTSKYIKVNFANTVSIIDSIGGIDLKATHTFCEQNSKGQMHRPDGKDETTNDGQTGYYCFNEGQTYHMDGERALAYARHRKTDDDIARGLRQQEVFKAIIVRAKNLNFWQWPSAYFKISTMIDTNLSHKEMLQVALVYAFKGDTTQYKFDWHGAMYNGVSYVELEPESLNQYVNMVAQLH